MQPNVEVKGLTFALNEKHKTATLINFNIDENNDHLEIPFSVKYNSKNYIVKKIAAKYSYQKK